MRLPLGCGSNGASSPTWSPSGEFLGFNCDQSIAVAYANGSNLLPIGLGLDSMLAWSPDGTQIVFSDQSEEQIPQLFVMNSDQPDWQSIPVVANRPSG